MKVGPEILDIIELVNLFVEGEDMSVEKWSDGVLLFQTGDVAVRLSPDSRRKLEEFLLPERKHWDLNHVSRFNGMVKEILDGHPELFFRAYAVGPMSVGGHDYEAGFWLEASKLAEDTVQALIQSLVGLFPNTVAVKLEWGPGADAPEAGDLIWTRPENKTKLVTEY